MSEKKKDLSAFLKKNQKKGKKEPVVTAPVEEKKEVQVEAVKEETKKSTTQKKEESSDEEVDDELDLQTQAMSYGNIKEKKDIASTEKQEQAETVGFGFDNTVASGAVSGNSTAPKAKKDASDITFGRSKPTFGRKVNKGQFGAEFSEGLDDIDDDGNVKNKPKNTGVSKADGGQREFINLGSKARVGGRPEEEKFESAKPTGVKPTFKGKLNLMRNTNEQDGDFGVKVNYDFKSNVSYPGAGEKKDRKPKAVPFENHMANQANEDEDGFEIVRNKDRKPRKKVQ